MSELKIQRCDAGYFSPLDPERVFAREIDARNHDKILRLRMSGKQQSDARKLDELIEIWHRMHGKTLRDNKRLYKLLHRVCESLGNPVAKNLTPDNFSRHRERRIEEVSTATANREHAYLRALFNELNRLGVISYENPLAKIRQFKERDSELRYLTHDEIAILLKECQRSSNDSLIHIVKICLATGARWSEAQNLKAPQIADCRITFTNTKNGHNRSVPISERFYLELCEIKCDDGEPLFLSALSAFRAAINRAGISLPAGQMSHVLRHTFASHFVMSGGNIVVLRDILGHSDVTTTMRYAHFAPDHLLEAVELNPLNKHM